MAAILKLFFAFKIGKNQNFSNPYIWGFEIFCRNPPKKVDRSCFWASRFEVFAYCNYRQIVIFKK